MKDSIIQPSEQEAQIAGLLRADLYSQARLSWGMNFLLLLVAFSALQSFNLDLSLSTWAALGALVYLLLLPSVVSASRKEVTSVNKPFYLFGLFLCGSVWGAFAYMNLPVQQELMQLTVIALPLFVCMVSLVSLSAWQPAFHAFFWPLAIPFVATLVLHSGGAYQTLLPVAVSFFGFCVLFSFAINKLARQRAIELIKSNLSERELLQQNREYNRARERAEAELKALKKSQGQQEYDATVEIKAEDSIENELDFLDAEPEDVVTANPAEAAHNEPSVEATSEPAIEPVTEPSYPPTIEKLTFEDKADDRFEKALIHLDIDLNDNDDYDQTLKLSAA